MRVIEKLATAGNTAALHALAIGIAKSSEDESKLLNQYEERLSSGAYNVQTGTDKMIAGIMRSVQDLSPPLEEEESDAQRELGDVEAQIIAGNAEVGGLLGDEYIAIKALKLAFQDKADIIQKRVLEMEVDAESMQESAGYAGSGSLDRVNGATKSELAIEKQLETQMFDVADAKTNNYRERMNKVFSAMGFEIDMDAVEANTNKGIMEEESAKHKMATAEAAMEARLAEIEAHKDAELRKIKKDQDAQMAAIMRMSHLSQAEREAMINKVKADAEQAKESLFARARAQIAAQRSAADGMDKKEQTLDQLMGQAAFLAGGNFQTTPEHVLKEQLAASRENVQKMRDRFTSTDFSLLEEGDASSLLQEGQGAAKADPSTAFRTLTAEVAKEGLVQDREDATWEKMLSSLA